MSRRTDDWDGPGTAFVVNDAIAYLDSLTLFFWQVPRAELLAALRKAYGRRLIVKAYEVPGTFAMRRRGAAVSGGTSRSINQSRRLSQP